MSNITIKSYDHCYKEQIIRLILDIQVHEFDLPLSIKDQPDLEMIDSFYQQGYGNFWVALDGDKVIGTIGLIDIGNSQSALRKMFVAKEYRGKENGIALKLLGAMLVRAKDNDINAIYLGTTSKYFAAHRFYEKNGFFLVEKSELPAAFPVMQVDSRFYLYEILC